jgi:hypothetical protein
MRYCKKDISLDFRELVTSWHDAVTAYDLA